MHVRVKLLGGHWYTEIESGTIQVHRMAINRRASLKIAFAAFLSAVKRAER